MNNKNNENSVNYLVVAVCMLGLGIFAAIRPALLLSFLPVVFGLGLILSSFVKIRTALNLKKIKYEYWWAAMIMGLVSVILGIVTMINPFGDGELCVRMIGIFFVIDGLTSIICMYLYSSEWKHYQAKIEKIAKQTTEVKN